MHGTLRVWGAGMRSVNVRCTMRGGAGEEDMVESPIATCRSSVTNHRLDLSDKKQKIRNKKSIL